MAKKYQILGGFPSSGVDRAEVENIIEEYLIENPSIGAPGKDGVSPTVSVQVISGGYRVNIIDAEGEHVFDIMHGKDGLDGAPGKDGFSPTVTIEEIEEGYHLYITDVDGTRSVTILHGKNAEINYDEVTQIVDDYLEKNPPIPRITINGEGPDENGNFVINTQGGDSNNVVEF